ncbi:MAG: hypothetical protein ACOY3V_08305, partial [Pseudomonadota bacterium]
ETERLKNITKVLTFYQNVSNAMSGYDTANGTSPIGAYSAFVAELSKTQNKELLTLFTVTAPGPDAAVHNSLTELFALGDQLKTVREQLYGAQIQQQFLDARKAAYAQNKVLSVSEFIDNTAVLDTAQIKTSINNIVADTNFIAGATQYLTTSNQSELYLTKLWDILSTFIPAAATPTVAEMTTLKSMMLNALENDTFAGQVKAELNALSPRDLYASTSLSAGTSIDTFIAEQATRADAFRTSFDAFVNAIPGATTTASAVTMINAWLANTTNVPTMQQDYAAEITYLMQNLNQTMPLNQFKIELTNFSALLANPSASEQQKFGNLALQQELLDALNQYHYAANFNAAAYPAELKNFVLLRGYNDLNTRYQEFLRLKASPIADEQAQAVLDLSGHPQEMQRHFYLNDFYAYLDGSGGAGSAQALADYMTGASTALSDRTALQFVAKYLASRKIDSQIIGQDMVKEFTNIVLHTRHNDSTGPFGSAQGPVTADINKEPNEFRTRLLMAKFDDYISNNTLTLTGGTPAALLADFKTKFDAFLTANAYRIGGVDLKDQLSGNIELADFRDKAYAYFNANPTGGGNLSTYLPTLYNGVMSANTFGAFTRLNADTLLPAALTAIAGFKTAGKGYLNAITGANSDALKTAYLKLSMASPFGSLRPDSAQAAQGAAGSNLPPDSVQIAQMISTSGYSISPTIETALNTYFNDLSLATKVAETGPSTGSGQVLSPAEALYNLRLVKTVETVFAGNALAKDGLLANRANLSAVENASYAALDNSPARVRNLAKNNEPGFMLAAWMLVLGLALTGNATANGFYSGLSTADKAAFDDYALSLGTKVSAENKKFVGDYLGELQTYLSQPGNSASVLFNGDLAKSEVSVRAAAEHLSTPALRNAAKENFNEFYKAFAQYMQGSGSGVTLGAATVTTADFAAMAAELNSQEKGFFKAEQPRLADFFIGMQELTSERTRVNRLMTDASLTNALFATDVAWEVKLSKTMAEANLTAITDAIGQKLRNNQAVTTGRQRVFARNMAVADNLKRFAALRGDTANLATGGSLFLNYRSFIQTVADKQAIVYTGATPDMPTYLQGKTLKQNTLDLQGNSLDDLLDNEAARQAVLTSDLGIDDRAIGLGGDGVTFGTAPNETTTYLQKINTVNATPSSDLDIAFKEHLLNNYLSAVSTMNRSLASVFAMAEAHDASTALTPGAVNTTNSRRAIVAGELSGAISTFKGGGSIDNLRAAFEGVQQNRNSLLVDDNAATGGLSENVLFGAQKQAEQSAAQLRDSRQQLAEAAHRDVLLGSSARGYLTQTFNQVATDLSNAEAAYNATINDPVTGLNVRKATYAQHFTYYTEAMNKMAAGFKAFQVENSDFEKKAAIKDFATTAYLFASSTQASSANEADAYQMYLTAKQNYDTVSAQLAAKADDVRTQDTLTELASLINKIDNNVALNAEETAMKATYQNFIDARKDYVLESERMIRVKKAQEIINAEIEKRKQVAALKLAAFETAKNEFMGYDIAVLQQQKAVYDNAVANIDGILQNFIAYVNTLASSPTAASAAENAAAWLDVQLAPYVSVSGSIPQIQALQAQMQHLKMTAATPASTQTVAEVITSITGFATERRAHIGNELLADADLYDPDKLAQNRDRAIATLTAIRASGGDSALLQTLSGMFYYDDTTGSSSHVQITGGAKLTNQAILDDRGTMTGFYNGLNPADKAVLEKFRRLNKIGAVSSGAYGAFKGANREMIQEWEKREDARHLMNWTIGVMSPVLAIGALNSAIGAGFLATAEGLRRSIWTRWMAPAFAGIGYVYLGIAAAMTLPATLAIYLAVTDYNNKDDTWNDKRRGMDGARDSVAAQLQNIRQKEEEYLQAQAALDYFTKAPSMSVMKERLIQYGAQTNDNAGINKYTLTEADLRYMFDSKSNYVDSAGTAYTPNAVDAGRVLNVSSATATPKFQTASGDKYDPTQTTTDNLEATLAGGLYWKNGDAYVKIKQMNHTGQMVTAYALKVANDIAPGGNWDVYSLGDVMNMTNNHGDALRAQLKQNYFAASNNHERTLMLSERDKTMWQLWDYAQADQIGTGQNGEVIYRNTQYGGFRMMAADYAENNSAVFQTQQQQNASLVTQQWDLRRAELDAARARWENLANTIESRGMESFNASEQKFLKAWRQWEIDTNRKIEAGKKQWDQKIQNFLVAKQEWQEEIQQAALEQSLTKMLGATGSSLNERLRALADTSGIGVDVPQMNVTDIVAQAVADFDRTRPAPENIFSEINKSINAFNVTLSLGNATHFKGFNSSTLEGSFAQEMGEFSKHIAILNNVKMYESFKKMVEQFKENLKKNDEGIARALTAAAISSGYTLQGSSYTKDAGLWGKYDFVAYRNADVDGLVTRGMRDAGLN